MATRVRWQQTVLLVTAGLLLGACGTAAPGTPAAPQYQPVQLEASDGLSLAGRIY